ncbi:MAG: heat-inducible transcriptional repressor HrcA [Ignavibacteriaceae bacterium]|nr:heat-inducible transcriptional repressor HrcA [Ignavibacteriaceae bacterium]
MHELLNEREKNILRLIIQQFILTASPVGSRNITKKYQIGLSPATVRNIMSDLEESGFINHPHTSAGRMPTDKGYRVYVDSLMELEHLNRTDQRKIKQTFDQQYGETEELLSLTSKLLSNITNQIACVLYPSLETGILEKVQLVTISSTRLLVVVSIKSGLVKTITLEYNTEFEEQKIQSVQRLLNERLSGLALSEIRATFQERFHDVDQKEKPVITLFLDAVDKIFIDGKKEEKLFLSGTKNLIKQPEFETASRIQSVIELLEEKEVIVHILEQSSESKKGVVSVSIGREIPNMKMEEYSVITKEYKFGENVGTLGIVGPKRMEYAKIIAIVDYVSNILTGYFTQR